MIRKLESNPSFNIVIATHQRCELLERTLLSLADARKPAEFGRVFVVENGSNDGSKDLCERYAAKLPLAYTNLPQPGKSRSIQWVMRRLNQGFALFLDDDIRVGDDLLEKYSAAIQKYGKGHFYGGPLQIDYEVEPEDWLKAYLPRSALGWAPVNPEFPFVGAGRRWFLGGNFGAFVEDVVAVGGFLSCLGPGAQQCGSEDNPTGMEHEIQNRFLQAGYKPIYVDDATAWHYVPRNRCTASWTLHRIYRNNLSRTLCQQIQKPDESLQWKGVPVSVWSRYIFAAVQAALAAFVPGAHRRFRMKRRFHQLRGKVIGYRLEGQQ